MTSNPYDGLTFFPFLFQIFQRIWLALQGKVGLLDLATDEVQMLVLIGVSASSALVGTFLVLRKMTMLANALSHTILLGIVIAFLFTHSISEEWHYSSLPVSSMLLAAFLTGLVTAFLTQFLTSVVRLQEDASIGLIFTSLFALGILLVTLLTRQAHIGAEVVMGNVDALHLDDLKLVFIVLLINVGITLLCFKAYAITTFDPLLAKALGFSVVGFNYLLMAQTAASVVGAFRAVGVLMVLAFLTAPVLAARQLTHDLKKLVFLSILLGTLASIFGVALSRHLLSVSTVDWDFPIKVCDLVLMGRYGRLGLWRWPREADYAAVNHYLDLVGMSGYADRQISQLSGGQQQRVFVARALVQEADIYFLDEPFAGVDLATETELMRLLRQLKAKKKTIFVVHHDLNTVEKYFDWVMMLNMRLVACGPVEQAFNAETLNAAYGKSYALLDQALKLSHDKSTGVRP